MRIIVVALSLFLSSAAFAQGQAPLQANLRVRVNNRSDATVSFQRMLQGGEATVRGSVHNMGGAQTAYIVLQFHYRTSADIALDEIISRIVISIEDSPGNVVSTVAIDPNTINLNPNRVPLFYSATLYRPPRAVAFYTAHVQVFGNYE